RFSRDWSSDVCSSDLFIYSFVRLSEVLAAFRVTEDDIPAADGAKHRCRHLTRISSLLFVKHVLRAEVNALIVQNSPDRIKRCKQIGRASCSEGVEVAV